MRKTSDICDLFAYGMLLTFKNAYIVTLFQQLLWVTTSMLWVNNPGVSYINM